MLRCNLTLLTVWTIIFMDTISCVGSIDNAFILSINASSGGVSSPRQVLPTSHWLPTYNFSVRQMNTIFWAQDKKMYAYADIVPFTDQWYPDSYSSDIGVFSSPDGVSNWTFHGLVLSRGPPGSKDAGGIATPGAATTNGTVLLSYAAESETGGSGTRWIALARAQHPLGPFEKQDMLLADYGQCHSDDSQLVVRPGDPEGTVSVYHRLRHDHNPDIGVCGAHGLEALNCTVGNCIRHRISHDTGITWSEATTAVHASIPGFGSATDFGEPFDAKWSRDGRLVLIADHYSSEPCPSHARSDHAVAPSTKKESFQGVTRVMNNTDFHSHNLPDGGCGAATGPTTVNYTTYTPCQSACDNNPACTEWTFVGPEWKEHPGYAAAPFCCLKDCSGGCPQPSNRSGMISGVKNPHSYHSVPPAPAPHAGGICLVVWISTSDPSGGAAPFFVLADPPTLQSNGNVFGTPYVDSPYGPQIALIVGSDGYVTHMAIAAFTDRSYPGGGVPPITQRCHTGECGPYTHRVFANVTRFGAP